MKKILSLLAVAFVLITICVFYLLKNGISLRPEGMITPSVASENLQNVAPSVVSRLFPEFQESDYVIFGWLPFTSDSQKVFEGLQQDYERNFHHAVNVLDAVQNPGDELLKSCPRPCWVLVPLDGAHQLKANEFITQKILPLQKYFVTLTWLPFRVGEAVPESCMNEKLLDFNCFKLLSIQKAQKKIKTAARYFFLNAYNETDHFLFIQETTAGEKK